MGRSLLLIFACLPQILQATHFTLPTHKGGSLGVTAFQPLPQLLTSLGRNSSEMARGRDIYKWCLFFWNSICSQLHVLFVKKSCDLNSLKPLSCVSCASWSAFFLKKKKKNTLPLHGVLLQAQSCLLAHRVWDGFEKSSQFQQVYIWGDSNEWDQPVSHLQGLSLRLGQAVQICVQLCSNTMALKPFSRTHPHLKCLVRELACEVCLGFQSKICWL